MRHIYVHLVAKSVEQFVYMDCFALVLLNLHSCMAIFSLLAGEDISIVKMPCDLLKTKMVSVRRDAMVAYYPTHNIFLKWGHRGRTAGPSPRGAHLIFR